MPVLPGQTGDRCGRSRWCSRTTPPPRPPSSVDLDDTARMLRAHDDAVEAKFRASVEAEKSKEDVLRANLPKV